LRLQVAAVRALLSHGAEVGPVIPLNGNTPLHVICKKTLGTASADDAVAIIKLLVGRGADLGAANVDGDRPLHLAVMSSGTKVRGLKLRRSAIRNSCRIFFYSAVRPGVPPVWVRCEGLLVHDSCEDLPEH